MRGNCYIWVKIRSMRLLTCSMTCFLLTTLSFAQPDSIYFGSYIDEEGTINYEIDRLEYEMETYCFAVSHIVYTETETDMEIYTETGFGSCAAVDGTFGVEMESQSDSIIRLEFGFDSNGDPSMIVHRDGKPDEAFTLIPVSDE